MATDFETIRGPEELQRRLLELKRKGRRIAVVPTMGALHEGHRRLIAEARGLADVLVVTVFVNPTQFGPAEDLAKYPRTFDADEALCREEGADFVFCPTDGSMYPAGFCTYVSTEGLGSRLCGVTRPTHFRGVTTVVAKLFNVTQADVAVFGWKDAQQLLIIRRMARDLNMPVEIVGVETVRESDGLALSSRNRYLSAEERAEAPVLYRSLQNARRLCAEEKVIAAGTLRQAIVDQIERESVGRIDYVEVVSMDSLEPLEEVEPGNTLIAVACFWGTTRLIDNIRI